LGQFSRSSGGIGTIVLIATGQTHLLTIEVPETTERTMKL